MQVRLGFKGCLVGGLGDSLVALLRFMICDEEGAIGPPPHGITKRARWNSTVCGIW